MSKADDIRDIRAVVELFPYAIDRLDADLLKSVFTPDVRMEYLGGSLAVTGSEKFVQALKGMRTFSSTNHSISNIHIEVDEDTGTADYNLIAILANDGEPRAIVRGIRYNDDVVRTADGWKVSRRVQTPQWQYQVPTVPLGVPGYDTGRADAGH